jgi:glutathione peroxidase
MELSFFKTDYDNGTFGIPTTFEKINVKDIDGEEKTLSDYLANKKALLIVNVASACGYTDSNYKQLQELQDKYSDIAILGFPCNQFAKQEDKCELDIKNYVKNNFKVTFPMFSKIEVNGPDTHPLYLYLKSYAPGFNTSQGLKNIPWNFAKFLVSPEGKIISYYAPNIEPKDIITDLEQLNK